MLQKDLIQTSSPVVVTEKPISDAPSSLCINGQLRFGTWPELKSQAAHTAAAFEAASLHDTQVGVLLGAVSFMQAMELSA